jgi:hypothetical protein
MGILNFIINFLRFNDRNWKAVILCVVAATVFWFFNALNKSYSANIRFPIAFEFDEEKYIPVNDLPGHIRLNVSGLGWDLFRRSIGIKLPPLSIPLENPADVKKIVGASLPLLFSSQLEGLQINYVLTDTIHLQIDPKSTRMVYLKLDSVEQYLRENFGISGKILIEPGSIMVEGPKSLLEGLPDTVALSLEARNIDKKYSDDIEVKLNSELINRIPPLVKVTFPVDRYMEVTDTVSVNITHLAAGLRPEVFAKDITLTYRLPIPLAHTIAPERIKVLVDLTGRISGRHRIRPLVKGLPEYSQLLQIDSVDVRF